MSIDERKRLFKYLLRSIFFDDCEDIDGGQLVGFYTFLLDSLEKRSDVHVKNNSDDYFVVEAIIQILSNFHNFDSALLFFIVKNPDNFKEVIIEQTALPSEFVDEAMERAISDFQDIKQGYLFSS